jgi:hypothetical protein
LQQHIGHGLGGAFLCQQGASRQVAHQALKLTATQQRAPEWVEQPMHHGGSIAVPLVGGQVVGKNGQGAGLGRGGCDLQSAEGLSRGARAVVGVDLHHLHQEVGEVFGAFGHELAHIGQGRHGVAFPDKHPISTAIARGLCR